MGLLSLVLRLGAVQATLLLASPFFSAAHAEKPPARWLIAERHVEVFPGQTTRVVLQLHLTVIEESWTYLPVSPFEAENLAVTLDDRPISPFPGNAALVVLHRLAPGKHKIEASFSLATPSQRLHLPLPQAPRSHLLVHAKDLQVAASGTLNQTARNAGLQEFLLVSEPNLDLSWGPIQPPPPRPTTIRVDQQTALIAEGTGVEGRSLLHIQVANGPITQLQIHIPGATELRLTGPGGEEEGAPPHTLAPVMGAPQMGSGGSGRWSIRFERPLDLGTRLHLRFVAPSPGLAESPAPIPTFPEAREGAGWLTLLQREELLLVPARPQGLTPAPLFERPASAVALADGTALAAYQVSGGSPRLSWQSLGGESMESPALLVDHAEYRLAHAAHGGAVLRATYQVRNDREQFLRVRLPPHMRPVGARVAGRHVQLVVVDAETILIPLEKSVETLRGLVAFPVELNLLGEGPAWARRGWRELQSPAIQAPIANAEWQVAPPPELRVVDIEGTPRPVGPTRALLPYDRGLSKEAPPEEPTSTSSTSRALSQELWNQAYSAYKDNRFGEADALLRRSLETDASNSAALALQDNVDLLLGRTSYGAEDKEKAKVARKVKAMASAKADSTRALQSTVQAEAEEAERSGDTDRAREAYRQLVEVTETLANLEQDEQVDQKLSLQRWSQKLGEYEQGANEGLAGGKGKQSNMEDMGPNSNVDAKPVDPKHVFEDTPIIVEDDNDLATTDSTVAEEVVVTREFLARVPTGRSYQAAAEVTVAAQDDSGESSEDAYVLDEEDARRLPVPRDAMAASRLAAGGRTLTANGDDAPKAEKKQQAEKAESRNRRMEAHAERYNAEITFDGLDISGELVKPAGSVIVEGYTPTPKVQPATPQPATQPANAGPRPPKPRPAPAPAPEPQPIEDLPAGDQATEEQMLRLSELGYLMPEAHLPSGANTGSNSGDVAQPTDRGGFGGEEVGGEGGVAGGVVGGVLGGVMGGAALPPLPAPEKPLERTRADRLSMMEADIAEVDDGKHRAYRTRADSNRGARAQDAGEIGLPAQFPQRSPNSTAAPKRHPLGPERPTRGPIAGAPPQDQPAPTFPQAAADATPPPHRSPPSPLPFRAYQPPPPPPRRAPVAPPEWPLPIPTGIDAATLTLSMPQPANPLLLRQQLVPSDEPLKIRLRTRPSKRPNED